MNAAVTTDFDTLVSTATAKPIESARAHVQLNRLHPGVLGIAALAYVALIGVFGVGFATSDVVFGISFGIVVITLVAFIGLPWAMARSGTKFWRRHGQAEAPSGTFRNFMNSSFETATGKVSGAGALALVATVPICLACGALAMAIIRHVV